MAEKAVLFDFEGTLVDFQWRLEPGEKELRECVAKWGFPAADFSDANYAMIWNRAVERVREQGSRHQELIIRLGEILDRYDADALSRWTPRPGARRVLDGLKARGIAVAVVSNVGRVALEEALERFGLRGATDDVVSRNDVTYMKPRPHGILRALEQLGVMAREAVLVGDSMSDVRAARAAGTSIVVITGGETDPAVFVGEDVPDAMVHALEELPERIAGRGRHENGVWKE